jgi:uncharacterized protein YdeI (YjbR/CyaY-like superfamily)
MKGKLFRSQSEFRTWLEKNHGAVEELWLSFFNRQSSKTGITYRDALDEALCFGWIDGVRKSLNETTYIVRFTPRKPKSKWSAVNLRRANELKRLGLMSAPGLRVFEQREQAPAGYSFEERPRKLAARYEQIFKANLQAWDFFRAQAPWYQGTSAFWVMSAKKEETREKRLRTLITDSERGRRLKILRRKE